MSQLITKDMLQRRALFYLERYAASTEGVRRVLSRVLMRKAREGVAIPDEAAGWIDEVLVWLQAQGYVNDATFAEMKVRSLRRAGASSSKVRQKLALKGVDPSTIDDALNDDDPDVGTDETAILAFARKRRLGPFCAPDKREALFDKQLAALARAGFSLALARRVLKAESVAALEEELLGDSA